MVFASHSSPKLHRSFSVGPTRIQKPSIPSLSSGHETTRRAFRKTHQQTSKETFFVRKFLFRKRSDEESAALLAPT